jgi:hypothetical protein
MKTRTAVPWKWIVGAFLLAYAGLFVASCFESTDCANCWQAAVMLQELTAAQEEFRRTDADRNGVPDYWRQDAAGLYTLALDGKPLKFINLSTAQADHRPASPVPGGQACHDAYWIESLGFRDEKTPDPNRFAYCAWPVPQPWKEWTFIVNQQGVVYGKRCDMAGPPEFYPLDPPAEGWVTTERLRKIRWRERNPLWWVRFWQAL